MHFKKYMKQPAISRLTLAEAAKLKRKNQPFFTLKLAGLSVTLREFNKRCCLSGTWLLEYIVRLYVPTVLELFEKV